MDLDLLVEHTADLDERDVVAVVYAAVLAADYTPTLTDPILGALLPGLRDDERLAVAVEIVEFLDDAAGLCTATNGRAHAEIGEIVGCAVEAAGNALRRSRTEHARDPWGPPVGDPVADFLGLTEGEREHAIVLPGGPFPDPAGDFLGRSA